MLKNDAFSVFMLFLIFGIPVYFWFWAIGIQLQTDNVKINGIKLLVFKLSIIYSLVYIVFAIYNYFANGGFIMPLHYAAIFSTFYAMLFAAKTLKSAEMNRKVKVTEYLGDFFLFCFFPIGIWLLQPRINKLINE